MNVLFYTGCFMFLATLLLLALIYSRLHWLLKAALILLSLGFSGVFYRVTTNMLGYPVAISPPDRFEFLGGQVHEPYLAVGDPGAVYVWIVESGQEMPRAIALPYSTDLRKQMAQAKRKLQTERVFMGLKPEAGNANGNADPTPRPTTNGNGTGGGRGDNHVPYNVRQVPTLEFQAPPDTVPRKGT